MSNDTCKEDACAAADPSGFFRGRVALVTGAGSGIGSAIALALGQTGAHVGVHYRRSRDGAEAVRQQIEAAGGGATLLQADLTKADEAARMFTELDAAFEGGLEMLVNNAGDWMDKVPVVDCPEAQWDHIFDVNVKSVFLCCQQAARRMIARGSGAIVNIGSIAGHTGGGGGTAPYGAAKSAVHTFTKALARELAPSGVRVNAVAPGLTDTAMLEGRISSEAAKTFSTMIPLGRMSKPAEIAPAVMMLLSPAASYITGEIIEVNGGLLMR
jgi:3-oxoacyl-[acyl-carrier protein] reductase